MNDFDHERLDVYVAAMLLRIVAMLVQMVRRIAESGSGSGTGTGTGTGTQ